MGEHTVTSFDEELEAIAGLIRDMGERAGDMVAMAAKALTSADEALAQRVISEDRVMDALQRDVDDKAVMLIGKRQPMAQDLRFSIGAMRMAGDLERIGDLAKNIGKRVGSVGDLAAPKDLSFGIAKMADLAREQVGDVIATEQTGFNRRPSVRRTQTETHAGQGFLDLLGANQTRCVARRFALRVGQ